MGVKEKALQAIQRERMLSMDCTVVVGISGGADSVTLLHVLRELQREGHVAHLKAVHVDHMLRGEESRRDRSFVERLCREWDIPLTIEQHDVAALAAEQGRGVEEVGRDLRYAAFERTATGNDRIATAHTTDDNAETLLLHLCRGSGLHGAGGIPPVRGKIIRPLITCTRDEIEAYCEEHGLLYVTDSTNADVSYARNRIRHTVLPNLREINPQVTSAITRFIAQARQTDAFLQTLTDEAVASSQIDNNTYSRSELLALDEPIRSRVLCAIAKTAEDRHIRLLLEALEAGNGAVVLPTGTRVCVSTTTLMIQQTVTESLLPFCFSVVVGERYAIGKNTYWLETVSRAEYEQKLNNSKYVFSNALDYDTLNGSLYLRRRRDGDRFHPAGRNCGKTLKKLFNEQKIVSRDELPIVCDEEGIVLVPDCGCDERVRVTKDTQTVLVLFKEEDV